MKTGENGFLLLKNGVEKIFNNCKLFDYDNIKQNGTLIAPEIIPAI